MANALYEIYQPGESGCIHLCIDKSGKPLCGAILTRPAKPTDLREADEIQFMNDLDLAEMQDDNPLWCPECVEIARRGE